MTDDPKADPWRMRLWEATLCVIAVIVVSTCMFVGTQVALRNDPAGDNKALAIAAFAMLFFVLFLVVGFFFGRGDHKRNGGS